MARRRLNTIIFTGAGTTGGEEVIIVMITDLLMLGLLAYQTYLMHKRKA